MAEVEYFDKALEVDGFKIENMLEAGIKVPWFRSLTVKECETIKNEWMKKFNPSFDKNAPDLYKLIYDKSVFLSREVPDEGAFDIQGILKNFGVIFTEKVYVDWGVFDDIDEFYLTDLSNQFDDIRYSGSDDISIFDASYNWNILILHYGDACGWKSG